MMKAVAQTEYGPSSVLKIIDVPKPVPGAKDLLVKMYAVATNPVCMLFKVIFESNGLILMI